MSNGVKSYKMFAQMFGGNSGGYVEMWKFENIADLEKFFNKVPQSDCMRTFYPEFNQIPLLTCENLVSSYG